MIDINKELPVPDNLEESCNPYYLVRIKDFGISRAMYCVDESGEANWYSNYFSKIIKPVTHYIKENDI